MTTTPSTRVERLHGVEQTAASRGRSFVAAQARSAQRGTAMVEYVVLLTTVALGLTLAVVTLGVPLVRSYLEQTTALALPFP